MMDRRLRARTVIGYKNTAAVPWCLLCELITLSLISHSSVTLLLSHTDTQTHTQTHTHTISHRHTHTCTQQDTHTHTNLSVQFSAGDNLESSGDGVDEEQALLRWLLTDDFVSDVRVVSVWLVCVCGGQPQELKP